MQLLFDLWDAGEYERWFEELGPDFVFSPDPSFPDAGTYRGGELRRWMTEWRGLWGTVRLERDDFVDHGDGVFTTRARWYISPTGAASELPVEDFTFVFWFGEDDRLAEMKAFFDEETALAEAAKRS